LLSIIYIDIRFSVHATEDKNKVLEAVQKVLPKEHTDEIHFEGKKMKGHYGNPIKLFEARIKKKEIIKALIKNLFLHLNEKDKKNLQRNTNYYTDNRNLYIRIDKQAAFRGKLRICTADPIRIHIRFKKIKNKNSINIYRELEILSI
jgi:RNA binding exosome subunit